MPSRRRFLAACAVGTAAFAGCSSLLAPDQRRWRRSYAGRVVGAPVVADGTVIVATVTPGDGGGELVAVGATDSERRWRVTIPEPRTGPAVDDGVVAVGTTTSVVGYDLSSGDRRWSVDVGPAVASVAAAVDGFYATRAGRSVVAVSSAGEQRWRRELRAVGPLAAGTVAVVAPVGDETANGEESARIVGLDPATGEREWTVEPAPGRLGARPIVDGDRVYVAGERLTAWDAAEGTASWSFDPGAEVLGTRPVVADGAVHVGAGIPYVDPEYGTVFRLDRRSGTPGYEYRTDDAVTALAGDDDGLFARVGRTLHAVVPGSVRTRWRLDVPRGPIAASDGTCYVAVQPPVGEDAGRLLAFDGTTEP